MPHHATQRVNEPQRIFFFDEDCCLYLSLYRHHTWCYGLKTLAYCVMDDHWIGAL